MAPPRGKSNNPKGRPPGIQNAATLEFKEAVNNLIAHATPQMVDWLTAIAKGSPDKALDHVYKFAQFGYPLLARTDNTNTNANLDAGKLDKDSQARIKAELLRQLGRDAE